MFRALCKLAGQELKCLPFVFKVARDDNWTVKEQHLCGQDATGAVIDEFLTSSRAYYPTQCSFKTQLSVVKLGLCAAIIPNMYSVIAAQKRNRNSQRLQELTLTPFSLQCGVQFTCRKNSESMYLSMTTLIHNSTLMKAPSVVFRGV